jgi:hypothetical protein
MQFDRTDGEFDMLTAEFSQKVADHLRPYFEGNKQSILNQLLPVVVSIQGEKIHRMLYSPDGVRFANNSVHIEFHDTQKYLTRGKIDWSANNIKLKEAYRHVFNNRNTSGPQIFTGIKFTVPGSAYEELLSTGSGTEIFGFSIEDRNTTGLIERERQNISDKFSNPNAQDAINSIEERNVKNIIKGHDSLNFNKISPWECIVKMNKKFGVTTWAGPSGNLWVGKREPTVDIHYATPDDSRVWHLSDYEFNQPRDPVVKATVRGGWTTDPSESWAENLGELALNQETKDFRLEAVAETKTTSFLGQEIVIERKEAKKDQLQALAKRFMMNKQREQQSGYIEIDPNISGTEISNIKNVKVGDRIRTIPPKNDQKSDTCESNIDLEEWNVTGVQHQLDNNASWKVRLDVTKKLDDELDPKHISTKLRHYDPAAKDSIEDDKYSAQADTRENNWWPNIF